MAISLNPVVFGLHDKVRGEYRHFSTTTNVASAPQGFQFASSKMVKSAIYLKERRRNVLLSVADSNRLSTDVESTVSDVQHSKETTLANSVDGNDQPEAITSEESLPQNAEASNGSTASTPKQDAKSSLQSTAKRSPLTARERLKAARLRNRYAAEPKSTKKEFGNRALKVLNDSEKGTKRSGLPEAPSNMLDDSRRGMPKPGLTFQFPGGTDLFFILLSFVTISTIMFATTYVVWKTGAIHFNEY